MRSKIFAAVAACALVASAANAHKPSYSEGEFDGPDVAYEIADPDVSIVVYHYAECDAPVLWMAFDLAEPRDLFVQVGVPEIERFADDRPGAALVAPGLEPPPPGLPFEVPEGMGVRLLDTENEPAEFYEPFSRTRSWIYHEETHPLPEAGRGYVVAWPRPWRSGRFWVAVGTVEDFGQDDFGNFREWMVRTQAFHETGAGEPAETPVEMECPGGPVEAEPEEGEPGEPETDMGEPEAEEDAVRMAADEPGEEQPASTVSDESPTGGGGCRAAPWSAAWWFALVLLATRRRATPASARPADS